MKNKKVITRCLLVTVLIVTYMSAVALPVLAQETDHIEALGVPPCSEKALIWCGPATARMIMKAYPTPPGPCDESQEDIWSVIAGNREESGWDTDPKGIKMAMETICPPAGQWVIHHKNNPQDLMYQAAYWMTKNSYPVALLLSTEQHNQIPSHKERWVVVTGFQSDKNPVTNDSINLKLVTIIDPAPDTFGDPAVTTTYSGSVWYSDIFKKVTKPNSQYFDQYVAVIEPPERKGKAIARKQPQKGKVIRPKEALEFAKKWIKTYGFHKKESYKALTRLTHIAPTLVRTSRSGYYLIPFVDAKTKKMSICMSINPFDGSFNSITAFFPVTYITRGEAVKMALDYLGIKTKKEIKVELVREFKKNVFAWYCPAWKITVGKKVVCVAQDGRIYTDELPGQGRGMEPQRKKK